MVSDEPPDIEEADLEIKPKDLPSASISEFFAADEVVFDRDRKIVKMDGDMYYLSDEVAEPILSDD